MWNYKIIGGDVKEIATSFQDNYFDGICADPPYGFKFMGQKWDYDVPRADVWAEILRVCKPGAHLISFGGARTYHRMACAVEDGGFEIRDCIDWVYGSGFPKSMNISKALDKAAGAEREVIGERTLTGNAAVSTKDKGVTYGIQVGTVPAKIIPVTAPATELAIAWDGYGSALKPAKEPAVLARKPMDGTMVQNVERWGVGGLAIDACRIGEWGYPAATHERRPSVNVYGDGLGGGAAVPTPGGRWPANVIFDDEAGGQLDLVAGDRPSTLTGRADPGARHVNPSSNDNASWFGAVYADSGGPSRFFYQAKVATGERSFGTEHIERWEFEFTTWENEVLKVVLLVETEASPPKVTVVYGMPPRSVSEWSTWLFGSHTSDQCPPGFRFTTRTKTSSITESITWRHSPRLRTSVSTLDANSETGSGGNHALSAESSSLSTGSAGTSQRAARPTPGVSPATLRELFGRSKSADVGLGVTSNHPTLKPIALTEYLAKLILPPPRRDGQPRRLLVPFAGAGSEMIGALRAGFDEVVGIEMSEEFIAIANARLARWSECDASMSTADCIKAWHKAHRKAA